MTTTTPLRLLFLTAVLVGGGVWYLAQRPAQPAGSVPPAGVTVTPTHGQAFGSLSPVTVTPPRAASGLATTTAGQKDLALPLGSEYAVPVYRYDGQITLPSLPVLQRQKTLTGLPGASAQVSLVNLSTFAGLRTDSVTWSQTTSDGYTISADRLQGVITITKVYDPGIVKALTAPSATGTEGRSVGPGAVDVPTTPPTSATIPDEQLITIAKNFLARHGIAQSGYDQPVIQSDQTYLPLVDSIRYTPPEQTVIFPWLVKNVPVYDQSGNRFGLVVSITRSTKTVASVVNIMTRSFTSSVYDLVTDTNLINSYLGQGGWYGSSLGPGTKTTVVTTAAPTVGYLWSQYQLGNGQDDLLVPALVFPLRTTDQATAGRQAVVVPVIKDLLTAPSAISPAMPASGATRPTDR